MLQDFSGELLGWWELLSLLFKQYAYVTGKEEESLGGWVAAKRSSSEEPAVTHLFFVLVRMTALILHLHEYLFQLLLSTTY